MDSANASIATLGDLGATWVVIFQGDSTSDLGVSKTGGSVKWMVKGESHGKPDQN